MKVLKIKIYGMHCSSCEKIIHMELEGFPGVLESEVDYKTGIGTIKAEDSVVEEDVLKVIVNTGYKAEII